MEETEKLSLIESIEMIRGDLKNNLLKEALEKLTPLTKEVQSFNSELVNLSGRISKIDESIRNGIITHSQHNLELNKVRIAIIELVNKIEHYPPPPPKIENTFKSKPRLNFDNLIIAGVAIVLLILCFLLFYCNTEKKYLKSPVINIDSLWAETNYDLAIADNNFDEALRCDINNTDCKVSKAITLIEVENFLNKYRGIQNLINTNNAAKIPAKTWYISFGHDVQLLLNIKAIIESNITIKRDCANKSKEMGKFAQEYLNKAKRELKGRSEDARFSEWLQRNNVENDIKIHLLISDCIIYSLGGNNIRFIDLLESKRQFDDLFFNKTSWDFPILMEVFENQQ